MLLHPDQMPFFPFIQLFLVSLIKGDVTLLQTHVSTILYHSLSVFFFFHKFFPPSPSVPWGQALYCVLLYDMHDL